MKSWIVYGRDGNELGIIKAGSMAAAEKKAEKIYGDRYFMVAYTEV